MSAAAIVSPGYPDLTGGVTDHTHRLADHWRADGVGVEIVTTLEADPEGTVDTLARRDVGALLLQYVPFLYGRRGLSTAPECLVTAARRRGLRTTVFVHEPWVPPTRLPWLVLSPLQRRQLRRLVARADAAVTPVPAWTHRLGAAAHTVYVGSTLGPPPAGSGTPLAAPVVFSPLAAGLNWAWIAAAAAAVAATPTLIAIGATRDEAARHKQLRPWIRDDQDWRGRLAAPEVLATLAGARLVLAPFVDGLTGRRTSALAALSTGAPLVSATGPLADPLFDEGPVILARDIREFADRARAAWHAPAGPADRAARRAWYQERFDPVRLDRRLRAVVQGAA